MMQTPNVVPLFANDLIGLIKILAIIAFTVLLPLAGLVVYFLKRGPDAAIATLQTAVDGLGNRVNDVEKDNERLDEKIAGIGEQLRASQTELMTAIRSSGEMQLKAVHAVEMSVARLEERSDLGEALKGFGRSIALAMETLAVHRS